MFLAAVLVLLVAVAAASETHALTARQGGLRLRLPCTTPLDCALSGDCVKGQCVCDKGWVDPPGHGTPCSAFNLLPADPERVGYRNKSWPSWGGHPVLWPKETGVEAGLGNAGAGSPTAEGDGKWHLFTPQFAQECTVDQWINNSFIVHAVGASPVGPWLHHDVSVPVWSHGSQAVYNPADKHWLLFFVGGWHYQPNEWFSCTPHNKSVPWPVEPKGPGLGPVGDCGPPPLNAGCGIRVARARSPYGPWKISEVEFGGDHPAKELTCARSDPAPYIFPNGTIMVAFGSGGCVGGLETVGVARAESWNSTFVFTSHEAIANVDQFHCRPRCILGGGVLLRACPLHKECATSISLVVCRSCTILPIYDRNSGNAASDSCPPSVWSGLMCGDVHWCDLSRPNRPTCRGPKHLARRQTRLPHHCAW